MTAAREPVPAANPHKPRPPRRRRVESEIFGDFTPWKNPAAVYAYYVSLAALIPVVGLVLGPIAIVLGLIGLIRLRLRPEVFGANFVFAGILLGVLNTFLNALGLWCVGHGLGRW
jgi:hypothetical protein